MKDIFRTIFDIAPLSTTIDYNSRIMLAGSCFSERIGEKLENLKFQTAINPFGILYNPASLAMMINRIVHQQFYTADELIFAHNQWISLDHHSKFSDSKVDMALGSINSSIVSAYKFLDNATHLIITYGSAGVFCFKSNHRIAGNCHKLPQQDFERRFLSVSEVENATHSIIHAVKQLNNKPSLLFTISPIRHWRGGAVENQRSKSILHTAIQQCVENNPDTYYFPAYELMMDDLRDYRFYADDMLHPTDLATEYIFQRFAKACISTECLPAMEAILRLRKMLAHKPKTSDLNVINQFNNSLLQTIDEVIIKYPHLKLYNERSEIEKRITDLEG